MIFPCGSIRKLAGTDWTPYCFATSLPQYFRSETWVHANPSISIAFSQLAFAPGLSNETPNTVKPLSLNCFHAATTAGFSFLQGTHQLAQKSNRTYLPRKSCKDTGLSSGSFWVKSIATTPMAVLRAMSAFCLTANEAGVFFNFS